MSWVASQAVSASAWWWVARVVLVETSLQCNKRLSLFEDERVVEDGERRQW